VYIEILETRFTSLSYFVVRVLAFSVKKWVYFSVDKEGGGVWEEEVQAAD
jgi:hypothetical protein